MELMLIRHALPMRVERNDNTAADPDLSEEGIRQAEKLAFWLREENLDAIYSSPMKRATSTARPLAEVKGLDIIIESGVAEFDQHSSSYVPMEELREKDYDRWKNLVAEGGFGRLYDLDAFQKKMVRSLETIISENRGKRVAVVCHGGVINLWAAYVLGMRTELFFAPQYTSINRFMASGSGLKSVATLNEAAHLRENLVLT
jgi:probable phosphoglycerate mutase